MRSADYDRVEVVCMMDGVVKSLVLINSCHG